MREFTAEHKEKLRLAHLGRPLSRQHRLALKKSKQGFVPVWLKDQVFSKETRLKMSLVKKGKIPANLLPGIQDEKKHFKWTGDEVSYRGLHAWVVKHLGQPEVCNNCGRSGLKGREIHWANKSRRYLRELDDWVRLCAKCHGDYDKKG